MHAFAVPHARRELELALSRYWQRAEDHVRSADDRRAAVGEYQRHLDALERRISASLDGALKLFGRVLARQSLLKLRSSVENLQRRYTDIARDGASAASLAALAAAERDCTAAWALGEPGFHRSEGADWVAAMQTDLTRLEALDQSLVAADQTEGQLAAQLSAAGSYLLASIPAPAAPPAPQIPSIAPAPLASPPAAPAPLAPVPIAHASPLADTLSTTATRTAADPEERRLVAEITLAALVLWLAIAAWTVRSIVSPVRHLVAATRKLAGGELSAHVPRGGVRELDVLAVAFNRMARKLRAARAIEQDYERTLETQVQQRTSLLQHLAEHDPLTLLANRRHFFVLLERALERAEQSNGQVALFFIDLDNFKNLNDSMGHAFGDRLLIGVAHRLEETAAHFGFAARLGGDEFMLVHHDVASRSTASQAGLSIVEAFRRPLEVDGREVIVSVSVGASLYPEHGRRAEDLLGAADAALFHAKAMGRNQLALFTPQLLENASRKFTTEQGVRRALERGQFELLFQPEVNLATQEVGLVEALVRWRLPDGRLATPDEFLLVTEESGLIVELGNWVLRRAVETASAWYRGPWPQARIAVNVSARQLLDPGFVERFRALLLEHELPARCIELELTESVLQTGATTIDSLRLLRSFGISIALDDFGTGYSSFASLEQLPLTRIKLDRMLIAAIDTNARSAAIATALIVLCRDLGIEVTAEGVERDTQFAALAQHPLYLQGYLLARPLQESAVLAVVRSMPQLLEDLILGLRAPAARAPAEPDLEPLTADAANR